MSHITLGGVQYVVSKEFADAVQKALGTLEFDLRSTPEAGPLTPPHLCWEGAVQREIFGLEAKSNHWPLTADEQKRKDFLVHVRNIASTVRAVGAHHDPVKEWDFDGWDAVHGNPESALCGCVRHYVVDHHAIFNHFGHNRMDYEEIVEPDGTIKVRMLRERKHHYIEPRHVCETHKAR